MKNIICEICLESKNETFFEFINKSKKNRKRQCKHCLKTYDLSKIPLEFNLNNKVTSFHDIFTPPITHTKINPKKIIDLKNGKVELIYESSL